MTTETISEAASLYVRVRPLARTGGHAKRGDKAKRPELKRVAGWGEEGVVVEDRAGARTTFDYMDTVLTMVTWFGGLPTLCRCWGPTRTRRLPGTSWAWRGWWTGWRPGTAPPSSLMDRFGSLHCCIYLAN